MDRSDNSTADMLSKLICGEATSPDTVYFVVLNNPSIQEQILMKIDPPTQTWMIAYVQYLENGTLLEKKVKAKQIRAQATKYLMKDGVLYNGVSTPQSSNGWLKRRQTTT